MQYRELGSTGLNISEISLGLEWLHKKKEAEVIEVIQEAIKKGINYFDIIFNFESFLKQVSNAIKGKRNEIILNHHLGSSESKGKYKKNRSIKKCTEHFNQFLEIMETDYVDIVFIHFVHTDKDFEECWKEGGVKDLALQLKEEGKARFVGMSTHHMDKAIRAAESGFIDVIMIQINLANHSHPLRKEFLNICARNGVGVIVMKPFAGGKLLQANETVTFANYQTAGHKVPKKKIYEGATSAQCLHYILNQVGVSAIVPGAANIEELNDCLNYYEASEDEKDYSTLVKEFDEYIIGECVYCNHCQPCQADIDIGLVNKLLDKAKYEKTEAIQEDYNSLEVKASECIQCGDCLERCPFDVPVIERMKEVVKMFE